MNLEICVSVGCINHCLCCAQKLIADKYGKLNPVNLSFDDFKRVLYNIPENCKIVFSGWAEPFQNRDSSAMMRYAFYKGHKVYLNTTLVGFTDRDKEFIADVDFELVGIHVPDESNFQYTHPLDEYLTLLNSWISLNKKSIYISLGKADERIKEKVDVQKIPIQSRAGFLPEFGKKINIDRRKTLSCIYNHFDDHVVLPNGNVYACCMDMGLSVKLGNLLKQRHEDLVPKAPWNICYHCEGAKVL